MREPSGHNILETIRLAVLAMVAAVLVPISVGSASAWSMVDVAALPIDELVCQRRITQATCKAVDRVSRGVLVRP